LNEWRQKKKDQPEEKMDVDDDEGDDDQVRMLYSLF
jgi:hypothetical protein